MTKKLNRRQRGELAVWRLTLVALLGALMRLAIATYVIYTIWLIATSGFEGWW